uniref:Palmitoyltransferase n=1 Tax=Parasteatoda tepidariorum TaxID=114398 RepID=A0A2L2Y3D2_PARTP
MKDEKEPVLPFSNSNILPKNTLDRGLFVLMTVGIPSVTIWENTILFQYHTEFDFTAILHLLFQVLILSNILGNLYYLQRVDSSGKRKTLPAVLQPNWKYCHFCQLNSPPRSYHCPICDECILKRDQHCMFAGCCVGFYNHRYYLMAVFYIMIDSSRSDYKFDPLNLLFLTNNHRVPCISASYNGLTVLNQLVVSL